MFQKYSKDEVIMTKVIKVEEILEWYINLRDTIRNQLDSLPEDKELLEELKEANEQNNQTRLVSMLKSLNSIRKREFLSGELSIVEHLMSEFQKHLSENNL